MKIKDFLIKLKHDLSSGGRFFISDWDKYADKHGLNKKFYKVTGLWYRPEDRSWKIEYDTDKPEEKEE